MGVIGGGQEQGLAVEKFLQVEAQHTGGSCPDAVILRVEQLLEQFEIQLVCSPSHPECLQFQPFVAVSRKIPDPSLGCLNHFGCIAGPQFSSGAVAGSVFRQLQVFEKFMDGSPGNFGWLDQGTRRIGHAVDTSVNMIAVGVTGVVLHVANQSILPIHHVKRTVGSKLQVGWAEVEVLGYQEIVTVFGGEAGVLIHHLVLLDAEKADVVVDQDVALNLVREMATGHELDPGSWAHLVRGE